MKKYLVLGGNGFIGRYIVERLSQNNQVIVADINADETKNTYNVQYCKINYIECEDFTKYLDGVDTVIHLVSTITANENTNNINGEISDNVFPTVRLLEDMVKTNVKNIFFVSSGGTIYGEHNVSPIKENEQIQPICNYGIIKDIIEKYISLYSRYYGINYRIVRLANPYSEVTKSGRKQGIIPIFIDQILSGDDIHVWGDGNDIRDYIYIDDAIDAIMKVLEYQGNENVFNVGTGVGYSVNQVISIIQQLLQVESVNVEYTNSRKCDVKNNILDISKAEKELNWKPKVSLPDGIQRVLISKRMGR